MYKMTAAHRTLPFDTVLRVTNLKNGMSTEVRINDRGPFVEGRIIDLSLGAARAIEMVGMGIAPVRIEMLTGPDPFTGTFTVQVGAFHVQDNAVRFQQRMEQRYSVASIAPLDSPQGLIYRVRVGNLPSEDAALAFAEQLSQEQNVVPFVVRLDPAPPEE
jgi:rare lipoprotein A